MKKNYFVAILLLMFSFVNAQIEPTNYRGAFAPSPTAMWTDSWTNYDPKTEPYLDAATIVNVTTDITASTTWTTGKTYKLTGLIYVRNNAVLTIQPGVVIKGNFTNTGTALIITKGAKLNAIGTATSPIVFTSAKTVAQGRLPGDWGGIVLLGKAGLNINNGLNNIEGITANVNTEYGGGLTPVQNDDSGTLKYVRIEFGGYVFSQNNEINGLTMGGVGSGTTIDNVQVSYANDDAFEWFGGSVNCKHLVSFRNLDDDFDTDNGYKGVVQFGLIVRDPSLADNPSVSTSEGFESDNNAAGTASGTGLDTTSAIFTNITAVGPSFRATLSPTTTVASGHERALRLRRATQLKIYNSIFMDFKNNFVFVDGSIAVANANANTLKFKNNIMAGNVGTFTGGVNPTSLNTWFSTNGNTVQATSAGLLALPYNATTNTYTDLDYRPGTTAASGADFTDASMSPYITAVVGSTPVVTNRSYCKGAVATPLTATLTTTGVSLRWYTLATGGTFTTTAPTPLTTTVGVKNYYVSQLDALNVESARVLLTVTTNALPTEVVSAITGVGPVGSTSVAAIGPYVGTTTQFVYSVTPFVDTTLTYLWTVPAGVNIISGQGTSAITVNFNNVAFGAGALGNITIQAVNASGCGTLAKTFALTKALLAAPTAINMYNNNAGYATPATAITTYGQYMGTTTELTLTATPVVGASSYEWDLPAGVNVVTGGVTPVTTKVTYTAEPFFSPGSAPSAVGTKFWEITYNAYTFNVNSVPTTVTTSTCVQKIYGNLVPALFTFTLTPATGAAISAGTVFTFNGNTYTVRTALAANGTSLVCTGSPGSGSTLPTSTNATLAGVLTNASTSATLNFTGLAFTAQSTGYGATTSAPYAPYGTVVSSNLNSILVKFTGVTNPATTALYLGVRSRNGVGLSVTSNALNTDVVANATSIPGLFNTTYTETATAPIAPSTNGTSTYTASGFAAKTSKLKKLTAAIPAAPTTLKLTNDAISTSTAVTVVTPYIGTATALTLTAAVSATASSYSWELPDGVTQLSGGNTNSITVKLEGVASGTTSMYFGVKAVNGIGSSITNNSAATVIPATTSTAKLLKVTAAVPAAPTTLALTNPAVSATALTNAGLYLGTSTELRLTSAVSAGATSYTWELPFGVTQLSGGTTNVITVKLEGVATGTAVLYFGVKAVNAVGSSNTTTNGTLVPATTSTAKLLKVTNTAPAAIVTLTGTITAINCATSYGYTITPTALASSYVITAPTGSVVTSASNTTNTSNVLATSDLGFSVIYPSNLATLTAKTIVVSSVNGFGPSTLNKTVTVAPATLLAVGTISGGTTFSRTVPKTISIPAVVNATSYTWAATNGAVITSGQNSTSIIVDFSGVTAGVTTSVVSVFASSNCGVNTAIKSLSLTGPASLVNTIDTVTKATDITNEVAYSNTSVYPNPASSEFNIDIDVAKVGDVQMSIYSITGLMVMNPKTINLEEGRNTINQNIDNLSDGMYIVRLVDASNNEVMVKKLIKR